MGMAGRVGKRWEESNRDYLATNQRASDVAGGLGAIAKVMRMMLQSAVLGVGAYLVINPAGDRGHHYRRVNSQRAGAGVGRSRHRTLEGLCGCPAELASPQSIAGDVAGASSADIAGATGGRLSVETLSISPPGEQKVVAQDITFALEAGQAVGVIGPSGSGKSSLVRALVGVWQPVRGKVRLDGAALDQWSPEILGRHIGYLPQDVELFAGTIAQNISRFEDDASPESIIAAARDPRPRPDYRHEGRLRHPDRRSGQRALGWAGSAHCTGASALRQSVSGGARRAELQSR
jgi:ATP-binding cassette subfamily C protein